MMSGAQPGPFDREVAHAAPRRWRFVAAARWMGAVALIGLALPPVACGQTDPEILPVLADMVNQKYQFKPDRLDGMGLAGLCAVLDELLPDTAKPKKLDASGQAVLELIGRLGDDSYRAREEATERLVALGTGVKGYLVEATRNADAEIAWRARRILRRWESQQKEDKARYVQAFNVYVGRINDDPRLDELVRRTTQALDHGTPTGSRAQILQQCISVIARANKEQYTDLLRPLLSHENLQIATLATRAIGAAANSSHCPPLLLEALQSDREPVVLAALAYTQNAKDSPRKEDLKRTLISIFESDNPTKKFQAALPLIYSFDHPPARDFLLQEARGTDASRQVRALSYLGNSRNRGKPADKKTLDVLVPLLKAKENHVRYMASRALGIYAGEDVVKSLIPLLTDSYSSIPRDVKSKLLQQPDKKMVRRLLSAAANDESNQKLKAAAAELLKRLGPE